MAMMFESLKITSDSVLIKTKEGKWLDIGAHVNLNKISGDEIESEPNYSYAKKTISWSVPSSTFLVPKSIEYVSGVNCVF